MGDNDEGFTSSAPFSHATCFEDLSAAVRDLEALVGELRAGLAEAIDRARAAEQAAGRTYEGVPLAYLSVDSQWRILDANIAAQALWGREREELIGRGLWVFLGRQVKHADADLYVKVLQEKKGFSFEHFSPALGKWLNVHTSPSAAGLDIWLEDMTWHKTQMAAHFRLWQQQKTIADNSPDIILRFGSDRTCLFANLAVERVLGVKATDLMGRRTSTMRVGHGPELGPVLDELLTGPRATPRETEIAVEGAKRHISWRVIPEHGPRSEPDSFLLVGRDVTGEREAEEARKALEIQLREAQKMEAVGTLSGGIAHDFNNILAVILGNAELAIDESPMGSPAYGNLENVRTAAIRGRDLVRQILAFSRKTHQKREALAVMPLVKETVKLLRSTLPATVELRVEEHAARDTVYTDPSEVEQVVINLATNGVRAMPEGGMLTVVIGNASFGKNGPPPDPTMGPGDYLALSVKDTGHGMDEETRQHIFEPFFTTRGPGEGSGLGLSVVYGIAKAHDGAVTVQSVPGEGAVFTVYLPLAHGDIEGKEKEAQKEVRGRGRVLFVDDEELLARTGHDILSSLGYEVTTETEPQEAMRVFAEDEGYDLVITDATMPGMAGLALARAMLEKRPDLPIILTTGYNARVDEATAQAAGIRAFLMKPYTKTQLSRVVEKVLRKPADEGASGRGRQRKDSRRGLEEGGNG